MDAALGAQPKTAAWGRCVQAVRARARAPQPTGKGLGHQRRSNTTGRAVLRQRSALRVNALQLDATTAWSVAGAASAPALFQASLLPYLGFLYFLGRSEARTPPVVNLGFRFLLVFVAATIPAGVIAKREFGDVLANVDLLHGSSESLLTVTNVLIVLGLRRGLRALDGPRETSPDVNFGLWTASAVVLAACVGSHATGVDTAAAAALGAEPANALSLPTWAIHVSSVTEWWLAMTLVWKYADAAELPRWKNLTWAMVPSLGSAMTACTFHLFYNPSAMSLLVTMQAGLTLVGNCCLLAAAVRICSGAPATQTPPDLATADGAGAITSVAVEDADSLFIFKLVLLSAGAGAAIKLGSVATHLPELQPTLPLGLAVVAASTLAATSPWTVGVFAERKPGGGFDKAAMMASIKSFGVAGTLAYIVTELIFWGIALPGAYFGYHSTTGVWLSAQTDGAQIAGLAATFVTGVRFLVPVRMGAALALTPLCDKYLVKPFQSKGAGDKN